MGWINRWKGKNVTINSNSPSPVGVCDDSGFVFNHDKLAKQMEWMGDRLVWTGKLVGPQYLDIPQEQNRPLPVRDDPEPVKDPRPRIPAATVLPTAELMAQLKKIRWHS